MPGLAGQRGDPIGQRQQEYVVEDSGKLDLFGGYNLPSLKELGLDTYVEKAELEGNLDCGHQKHALLKTDWSLNDAKN